jgi:phenylpropionate dioxygenase-like ring-hydroxylating dioxygenase large terminal subunit
VPHEAGFPGLDKSAHGLVPVHAEERLGLVFINQEKIKPEFDALPALIRPEQPMFATAERELEVNWKVFLEGFIEGYHIRFTHPESFYPYGYDNLNVIDFFGRSSRITYPFRRIQKLEKVAPGERKVAGLLTYVYHLFPNVLITILSRHTNVVVLEPLGVSRTRQITYTLANDPGEAALAEAKRDKDFVGNTGALEDLAVVTSIQRSIGSGANEVFTFGHFEGCIGHFHRALASCIGTIGKGNP